MARREKHQRKGQISSMPASNVMKLLNKVRRQEGDIHEKKAILALKSLLEKKKILSWRPGTKAENHRGKDYIFKFKYFDGTAGEGWLDVKSGWKGVQEHKKKNELYGKKNTPALKRTRPAVIIRAEDTVPDMEDKILWVIDHFSKLYKERLDKLRQKKGLEDDSD